MHQVNRHELLNLNDLCNSSVMFGKCPSLAAWLSSDFCGLMWISYKHNDVIVTLNTVYEFLL